MTDALKFKAIATSRMERAAAQITGVKVHPVQTKHGMFVSAEHAAACQEFLRNAKRAGKRG